MLGRIVGTGLCFFAILVGLWQLLHHVEISSVRDIISEQSINHFAESISTLSGKAEPLTRYELGIFFSVFVILQFWNMFNAKYFATRRSLILDLVDLVRKPQAVKESYSLYFVMIAAVILVGQVLIVNFASDLFGVAPLSLSDWGWIILLTSPVLLVPDIVRMIRR
jgi:Ca2+-transporting ATPase